MTKKNELTCRALDGKTVRDVLQMPRFLDNLSALWDEQRALRSSAEASVPGKRLASHVICSLMGLSEEDMVNEYALVLSRVSTRSAAQRKYILQLGSLAYSRTVAQLLAEEHPEMRDEILGTKETN